MSSTFGDRIAQSALFQRLKRRALEYVRNPEQLMDIVARAGRKADATGRGGVFSEIWDSLLTLLRLLKAYVSGAYRNVPTRSLVLIIAAILYLLTPIDLIPDFIFGLGLLDDAAILAWVINDARVVLEEFRRWESAGGTTAAETHRTP